MTTVLVTGASGFVGRALCQRLLAGGYGLVAASRAGTDYPNARNMRMELVDPKSFSDVLEGVDVVIHLAARAHQVDDKAANPLLEFRKINRDATVELARAAALAGARRFVYVSSIGVNGNESAPGKPFTESDKPRPHDLYAISKHEAELALTELGSILDMEIVIVRPPLVYGAGAPGNFARLLKLVKAGLPLPLGRIRNLRSFIYVENLADVLVLCAIHPEAANRTFVVSDGEDLSTADLIREIASILKKTVYILPVPVGILRNVLKLMGKVAVFDKLSSTLQVDSSSVRSRLGWRPPISLREGLKATLSQRL